MDRTLDPVMPASSSDDEIASHFSKFFVERITCIRSEIDTAVVNREFSVDFPLRFTRGLTFSHFRLVTEADVLRYMKETRKTFTRSYQCLKVWGSIGVRSSCCGLKVKGH